MPRATRGVSLVNVFASDQPMLSNSAGSHNTTADTDRKIDAVSAATLVQARAECLELALHLGERARQLLTPRGVRRRFKLPAELGVREAQRFGTSHLFRVAIALRHRTPCSFFLPLVHAFLDAVLCVDEAFTCVCHLHLLVGLAADS